MICRHCGVALQHSLVDLGAAPPSNAYLNCESLLLSEKWYPLQVMVCGYCWLVQTVDYANREDLFTSDYAYFSSYSSSWLDHAKAFVAHAVREFALDRNSVVVELAANDGYLLQYVQAAGIPCYGVEPTSGTATVARSKGIEIIEEFFGVALAQRLVDTGRQADLIIANNVLAHVPKINDFVAGVALLLKPNGVASFEFPHVLELVKHAQFDTIYHEHYSYLSLTTINKIFRKNGLALSEVHSLPTHGGSLRVFARRLGSMVRQAASIDDMLQIEEALGVNTFAYYGNFQSRVNKIKNDVVGFLIEASRGGAKVAAYGAAAKGNTLLNYAGVRADLLHYVVDKNPAKQGCFLPGSRIPIVAEQRLRDERPDYVLILPWNLRDEIVRQLSYIRGWGGRFVVAVPELEILK